MPDFSSQPFVEVARRLEVQGAHSWLAVLSPLSDPTAACDALSTELESFLQTPVRVVPLRGSSFERLREQLHQPEHDAVILFASGDLEAGEWSSLDSMRSALERRGPVVLWMAPDAVGRLTEFAPNIRSFIGSSIFLAGPEPGIMTDKERESRLEELRQHYQLSDQEIVRRAEAKELPPEPHFVEWLVLVGRGDLV
ncbi:MAG: hypothetical protein ABSE93_08195 [Terriglobia bacterium]